ncbi:hypothetical protein [Mucilaginibacter sp. 3215]|uniref:hypothetical protein n=1 Tax=Mucilaginibacter sp. 3215 TaxID=3373912 RepID=UPI003D23A0E8
MNASSRIKKRKTAKDVLNSINEQQANYLIVHYSCESFFDIPYGRTPRITSIAVKYFETGQTKSFSIHKVAEVKGIAFDEIEKNYDDLERIMLDEFYSFVNEHKRFKWFHLNMRNINFGFEAIAHRYSVLGGTSINIDDGAKFDIGRLLNDLYGSNYIGHPRIETLCKRNNITMTDFLNGEQEAQAFNAREYVKLHQSTLRKVENLQVIIERANENSLKTDSTLIKQYGISPQSLFQMMQENWLFAFIVFILTLIISTIVGKIF